MSVRITARRLGLRSRKTGIWLSKSALVYWDFPSSSVVKNPPMQETWEMWVQSLGQEDPLE